MPYREVIGISAGALSFVPCPIYVMTILRGETKPDRVTWWVLSLASLLLSASNWSVGARDTIWLPVAYTMSFLIVAILSLRYGDGPARLHRMDRLCVGGAILGVAIWWRFQSPAAALYLLMAIEFVGLLPTIAKAAARPGSENRSAWTIATAAAAFNLFALTSFADIRAAYPLYVFITNAVIAGLLFRPVPSPRSAARGTL